MYVVCVCVKGGKALDSSEADPSAQVSASSYFCLCLKRSLMGFGNGHGSRLEVSGRRIIFS